MCVHNYIGGLKYSDTVKENTVLSGKKRTLKMQDMSNQREKKKLESEIHFHYYNI